MVRQCVRINYMHHRVMEGGEEILACGRFLRYSSQNFYFYTVTSHNEDLIGWSTDVGIRVQQRSQRGIS